MIYRKTWFSYVLWALYAGLCIMLLAFMGFYLYSEYISPSMAKIGGLLVFPIAVGIYWAIREISQIVRKKYVMQEHTVKMLEVFVVACCVVFGTLFRISAVLGVGMVSDTAIPITDVLEVPYSSYFDMAIIRSGERLTPLTHGAGYLYVLCISAVCSFLGNKIVSAMFLQAVIQIVSIVLSYLVVRKAAGRLPACTVLIYLSFSRAYISEISRISPDCFVFLLYLIGLLLVIKYIKDYCNNQFSKSVAICGAVLVGVVTGILVYLDAKFIVLLVFMIGLFTGKKENAGEEQINNTTAGISAAAFVVSIVSCAAGLCAMFGIAALYQRTEFLEDVTAWFELYMRQSHIGLFDNMKQVMLELPAVTLITVAAAFLIFEFFRENKEQNFMLWILACILIAPTPMAEIGILPYPMIALFQWSVLAGLGLQNCIFGGQAKVLQAKIEEINASAEPIEERPVYTAEKPITEEQTIQNTEETMVQEKPRFIENPLPLPKKHVKKEMDYQYPVDDKDMKYDIEIDENDDFDIQ